MESPRSFDEFRTSGLLWLVNRVVFHPRGYALQLHYEGSPPNLGNCTGWSLIGDGMEVWAYDGPNAEGKTEDDLMLMVKELLK